MDPLPTTDAIRSLADHDPEEAARALAIRIAGRQDACDGHDVEAHLAESLGLIAAAVRAWQLHLRDHPDDDAAWAALAVLHQERGDAARARACLERRSAQSDPSAAQPSTTDLSAADLEAPAQDAPLPGPSDADLVRFCHLFGGREGVHARMFRSSTRQIGYTPVHRPLTPELVRAHLQGSITVGSYLVRSDDTVTCVVFDVDATRRALDHAEGDAVRTRDLRRVLHTEGLRMLQQLQALGLDPLLIDSGHKGRHLWLFLDQPTPATEARHAGRALLGALSPDDPRISVELFPKQDRVAHGGLGNLVKLPLGVHLRTGRRAALLDDHGEPLLEPFARLRTIRGRPLPTHLPQPGPAPQVEEPAPPTPPAPPVPEAPRWTEGDFDADPEVSTVLAGCAVLRALVDETLQGRSIDRDGAVVLAHSLGHLARGPDACNYIFDQVPGFPDSGRMGARHRGSPVSCARIRKRLPQLCKRVPCGCSFPEEPGSYAHPLRNLDGGVPVRRPASPGLDDLLAAWGRHLDRLTRLQGEGEDLRRAVTQALSQVPGGCWTVEGGDWAVVQDEGLPVLEWRPVSGED